MSENKLSYCNIRPIKLAFLVPAGDHEALLRAVEECTTCWGGMSYPILPVNGRKRVSDWAKYVLKLHDPDFIVDLADIDNALSEKLRTSLPSAQIYPWETYQRSGFSQHMLAFHPLPEEAKDKQRLLLFKSKRKRLCRALEVAGGLIPGTQVDDYNETFNIDCINVDEDSQNLHLFFASQRDLITPIAATLKDVSPFRVEGGISIGTALVISDKFSFDDMIFFWNCRATVPVFGKTTYVFLMPAYVFKDSPEWLFEFLKDLSQRGPKSKPDFLISSPSINRADILELLKDTTLTEFKEKQMSTTLAGSKDDRVGRDYSTNPLTFVYQSPFFPSSFHEGITPHRHQMMFYEKPKSTIVFEPPQTFRPRFPQSVSFDIEEMPGANFPRSQPIARMVHSAARFTKYGISIVTQAQQRPYEIDVYLATDFELFKTYFVEYEREMRLSDKGQYVQGLLDRVGGLTNLTSLFDKNSYSVMACMTPPSRKKFAQHLKKELGIKATTLLITQAISNVDLALGQKPMTLDQIAGSTKLSKVECLKVLDELTFRNLLYRGLLVRCAQCGYKRWYALRELDEVICCAGCGCDHTVSVTEKGNRERQWTYVLNELMARVMDQDVWIHLLLANTFVQGSPFLPGVVLGRGTPKEKELDVVVVRNKRLTICECKKRGAHLSLKELRALVEVAKKIQASEVLLACFDSFEDTLVSKGADLAEKTGLQITFINGHDLFR